jgi:ATP/maltotriose-dependent transcriptional regulator MalT
LLILDGVHVARAQQSIDAIAALCEHWPAGAKLVVAARDVPHPLPLGGLRAHDVLLEVGPVNLALELRGGPPACSMPRA